MPGRGRSPKLAALQTEAVAPRPAPGRRPGMSLCPSCRRFLQQHRRALRWAVMLAVLAAFFFWVGANAPVTTQPYMCKVYG